MNYRTIFVRRLTGDFYGGCGFSDCVECCSWCGAYVYVLPASVRSKFDNDPQALMNFVDDVANFDEAVRLGVLPKAVEVDRVGDVPPKAV